MTYTMLQRSRRYAWWTRTSSHWPSLTRAPLSRSCTRSAKPSFSPSSTSAHAGSSLNQTPFLSTQRSGLRMFLEPCSTSPSSTWEALTPVWGENQFILGDWDLGHAQAVFQPNNLIVLGEWSNASRCCSDNEPFICRLLSLFWWTD